MLAWSRYLRTWICFGGAFPAGGSCECVDSRNRGGPLSCSADTHARDSLPPRVHSGSGWGLALRDDVDGTIHGINGVRRSSPRTGEAAGSGCRPQRHLSSYRGHLHSLLLGDPEGTLGLEPIRAGLGTGCRGACNENKHRVSLAQGFPGSLSRHGVACSHCHRTLTAEAANPRPHLACGWRPLLHEWRSVLRSWASAVSPYGMASHGPLRQPLPRGVHHRLGAPIGSELKIVGWVYRAGRWCSGGQGFGTPFRKALAVLNDEFVEELPELSNHRRRGFQGFQISPR